MNTRQSWIFGMAALGLAVAAPVEAAPDFTDGPFMIVKNEGGGRNARSDEFRNEQRDDHPKDVRRPSKREAVRDEPQGYGYGYERRQQQRPEENDRSRGRH